MKVEEVAASVNYGRSLIAGNRLEFLAELCGRTLMVVPGNVLEVGVYRGGSLAQLSIIAKNLCPQHRVIGVDTFRGHPYSDGHPEHPKGKFGDTESYNVDGMLKAEDIGNTVLVCGRVEQVADKIPLEPLSFVHVDCDLYLPTRYCIEHLWSRLQPGGVMVFDDYLHPFCPGVTKAVNETWGLNNPALCLFPVTFNGEIGAYITKEEAHG